MNIEVQQSQFPPEFQLSDSYASSIQEYPVTNTFTSDSRIEINLFSKPELQLIESIPNCKEYEINTDQVPFSNSDLTQIGSININPEQNFKKYFPDLDNSGQYEMIYNFYDNAIGSSRFKLYISQISPDRTEIKLKSFDINEISLINDTNLFLSNRSLSTFFEEFYLNFGENEFICGVNILLDEQNPLSPCVLVKLKDPLPFNYSINDSLFIVKFLENPISFTVSVTPDPIIIEDTTHIQGPNFNIDLKSQVNNSTLPLSYIDLITTSQTSSLNQLQSLLSKKSININIDYTEFSNFIHFSSAQTRLENFQYKIGLIESYSSSLNILNNTSLSTNMSSSKSSFEGKISNIINNFDGYERFLYYSSGSFSYPKTTNQIPYTLAKSTSTEVINWLGNPNDNLPSYGGMYASSSKYDINNRNQLLKSIPEYLRDDSSNQQYQLFVDMVAQYYDNIWIYIKDITNKYDNDNRLNFGISKDLVSDAIRDFGIKLYQNNFSNDDLFTAFLGLTPDGGLFPYPNMTGSLPTPTGFEYVNTLISASNDILPQEEVNKSLYKRIYHNLPYLINSKGTIPGLRALITSYGIPDTILRINEYGGKDKVNINDWDHWQNEFNYAFHTSGSNFISSSWELDSAWGAQDDVPNTLMFRFKTDGLPTTGSDHHSQSLWFGDGTYDTALTLRYTGSGYTSGSYSGSIKNPYYQYATLNFFPDRNVGNVSASVYLPFFDGNWWSVMLTRQDNGPNSTYTLHAGNKLYEGGDNDTRIGFYGTSSIDYTETAWTSIVTSYFPVSFSVASPWGYDIVTYDDTAIYDGTSGGTSSYSPFSGSYQEIRYYTNIISENVFKDYVMNPYSIEGNSINSSPDELAFRASIGGELYTGSTSIHPKVTGSWTTTQSFATGNSDFYYDSTPQYVTNKEYFFVDQPIAGIKNVIGDKIRIEDNVFPGGYPTSSVLSPYKSILQQTNISQSYTPNLNYLEVAFSPQNQINEDIMSQIGFFNIGDYIGDPRLRSSSAESYPDLDKLRDDYFKKYIKNYDLKDFIRLIKFFDNSLFKMIKDFIPARTSLASGLIIKQHLLERNKYPQPQVDINTPLAKYPKSGSIIYNQLLNQKNIVVSGTVLPQSRDFTQGTIVKVGGGTGGSFEPFNNLNTSPYGVSGSGPTNRYFLTQSWSESIDAASSGSIIRIISNQDEFYDGEFSGSNITVTTQSLSNPYPIVETNLQYDTIVYKNSYYDQDTSSSFTEGQFLNPSTTPCSGEALFLAPRAFVAYSPSFPKGKTIFSKSYIKIHGDDCDGENKLIPLKQATQISFQHVGTSAYTTYDIDDIIIHSNYCTYKLKGQPISLTGGGITSTVENYFVTASRTTSILLESKIFNEWSTVSSGSQHCGFNMFPNGKLYFGNTPNIPLIISASFNITATGGIGIPYGIYLTNQKNNNRVAVGSWVDNTTTTTSFDTILYPLKDETYFIEVDEPAGVNRTINNAEFLVTQSIDPVAPQCINTFIQPYITLPNYYNSNFNPTINNVMDNRLNTIYQTVDYSSGINFPVNFLQLISGSAINFPIPDSHYTQKSSVIPRYEGAKSTSQKINVWTSGDKGTYGKSPTVESLKSLLVYADWIGGYPPEHMNASGVHVQYIIDQNGTIKIPNTSENTLEDIQHAYESNKLLELHSNTVAAGESTPTRNIIRGGSRIVPVLYTQSGSAPAAQWVTTIALEDKIPSSGSATSDYQVISSIDPGVGPYALERIKINPTNNPSLIGTTSTHSPTGNTYSYYEVDSGIITENITLNFQFSLTLAFAPGFSTTSPSSALGTIGIILKKEATTMQVLTFPLTQGDLAAGSLTVSDMMFVNPGDLNTNDQLSIEYAVNSPTIPGYGAITGAASSGYLNITQTPIPSSNITVGNNAVWGYPDKTLHPNTITSSVAVTNTLGSLYGDPNVKQTSISNSGFNTVDTSWSIEIGDEFRFEGVESNTFMVKQIYGPNEGSGSRFTPTGSIEVQFNRNLPISSSINSFNLDHFLIRRYIPDASQIIIEGFKPINSVGPYIAKPEYVTPLLNKGIDDYIADLTDKGLI